MQLCPICRLELSREPKRDLQRRALIYSCEGCGDFGLSDECLEDLSSILRNDTQRLVARHKIREFFDRKKTAKNYLLNELEAIAKSSPPWPREMGDKLIYWLGENSTPGEFAVTEIEAMVARLCLKDRNALIVNLRWLADTNIIQQNNEIGTMGPKRHSLILLPKGWERHEELQRGVFDSKIAFMAMQFNDDQLNSVVRNHFFPAVKATGFDLKSLQDGQPAGLIDDRLRVEIRNSRFLIADLSHHNNGAYWEAGYAEGLGKPVIYTCKEGVPSHFDTNHHLTVFWNENDIGKACQKLKDTIRATLPTEAVMEDHS